MNNQSKLALAGVTFALSIGLIVYQRLGQSTGVDPESLKGLRVAAACSACNHTFELTANRHAELLENRSATGFECPACGKKLAWEVGGAEALKIFGDVEIDDQLTTMSELEWAMTLIAKEIKKLQEEADKAETAGDTDRVAELDAEIKLLRDREELLDQRLEASYR
jgi:DNA repair exonuclease SbcCD ATPase subunit